MSEKVVTGYWNTAQVRQYFGGISSRTLTRWKEKAVNPFPQPRHSGLGSKSLYLVKDIMEWDERNNG